MSERTDKLHNQTILIIWLFLPDLYRSNLALYWLPLQSLNYLANIIWLWEQTIPKKISFMVNMSYSIVCNVFFFLPMMASPNFENPESDFSDLLAVLKVSGPSVQWGECDYGYSRQLSRMASVNVILEAIQTANYITLSVSKIRSVTLQTRNPHAWPCRGAALKKV